MKRLMIVSALALVLASGVQLAAADSAQAGERQYRHGGEIFGLFGHFYGDRHAHDGRYKKDRHFDRRHDRRHYGFVQGQHKKRHYGHYKPHRKWRQGQAAWQHKHWHHKRHWKNGHRSFVYRY